MCSVPTVRGLEVERGLRPSRVLPRGSEASERDRRVNQHPPCAFICILQKCVQQRKEETLVSRCRDREVPAPPTLLKSSRHKANAKQKHKLSSSKRPGDICDPKPQRPCSRADGGVVNDLTEPQKGNSNCRLFRGRMENWPCGTPGRLPSKGPRRHRWRGRTRKMGLFKKQ